jgi:cytoskeletal protein CcmA (bactofilin family)
MSDQIKSKTVLGADCRLNGELALESDAVIMGQFKGTLRINGDLEIAESAKVAGGIVAGAVRLAGTVDADILRVSGTLEITSTAKVTGTIIAGTVRIAGHAEADIVAEHGIELLAGAQLSGQIYTTTLQIVEGATFQGDVCVGPKAIQAAGALLRQAQETSDAEGEAKEIDADPQADPASPNIHVGSGGLNSLLQRRRAKILTGAGAKPTAPETGNGRAGTNGNGNGHSNGNGNGNGTRAPQES